MAMNSLQIDTMGYPKQFCFGKLVGLAMSCLIPSDGYTPIMVPRQPCDPLKMLRQRRYQQMRRQYEERHHSGVGTLRSLAPRIARNLCLGRIYLIKSTAERCVNQTLVAWLSPKTTRMMKLLGYVGMFTLKPYGDLVHIRMTNRDRSPPCLG